MSLSQPVASWDGGFKVAGSFYHRTSRPASECWRRTSLGKIAKELKKGAES